MTIDIPVQITWFALFSGKAISTTFDWTQSFVQESSLKSMLKKANNKRACLPATNTDPVTNSLISPLICNDIEGVKQLRYRHVFAIIQPISFKHYSEYLFLFLKTSKTRLTDVNVLALRIEKLCKLETKTRNILLPERKMLEINNKWGETRIPIVLPSLAPRSPRERQIWKKL